MGQTTYKENSHFYKTDLRFAPVSRVIRDVLCNKEYWHETNASSTRTRLARRIVFDTMITNGRSEKIKIG